MKFKIGDQGYLAIYSSQRKDIKKMLPFRFLCRKQLGFIGLPKKQKATGKTDPNYLLIAINLPCRWLHNLAFAFLALPTAWSTRMTYRKDLTQHYFSQAFGVVTLYSILCTKSCHSIGYCNLDYVVPSVLIHSYHYHLTSGTLKLNSALFVFVTCVKGCAVWAIHGNGFPTFAIVLIHSFHLPT